MFVFPPQTVPVIPVYQYDKKFPVHRIYCVGQNYTDHAIEMGVDPSKEAPVFFMKPADAVVVADEQGVIEHPYPENTQDYHYEVEWVVAVGKEGKEIPLEQAQDHVYGYALGLDMTKRDLQSAAKNRKGPWDVAKGFDRSALLSQIYPIAQTGILTDGIIELKLNNQVKQSSNINQLIWSVPNIIHYLSFYFELKAGDLIFTGTPSGIGPVQKGDVIDARIESLTTLSVRVV